MLKLGKVYRIICLCDPKIQYIGSTFNELRQRWTGHKTFYKRWQNGNPKSCISIFPYFEKYGIKNFKIVLIKEYMCFAENNRDHKHLSTFEQLFINRTKCVNKINAFRIEWLAKPEIKDQQILYRDNNKDKIKIYNRMYRENNKEIIILYNENNKGKIREQRKLYYEMNKGKIRDQHDLYREMNKDKIKDQQILYRDKNKAKIQIYRDNNKAKAKVYNRMYRQKKREQKEKALLIGNN